MPTEGLKGGLDEIKMIPDLLPVSLGLLFFTCFFDIIMYTLLIEYCSCLDMLKYAILCLNLSR